MSAGMAIMADMRGTAAYAELHAAGYHGAFGYSSHNQAKCPSRSYGADLVDQGGLYCIVFEDRAERALDGFQAGVNDANYANEHADIQSYPLTCAIYLTADFDARWEDIKPYTQGAHSVSKRPLGLYGDGEVIREAKAAGLIKYGWRTCSAGFRGSRDLTGVDLVQACAGTHVTINGQMLGVKPISGHSVDTNYSLPGVTDFGAWSKHSTPNPNPTLEDDMFTQEDRDKLEAVYNQMGFGRAPDPKKPDDNGNKFWQLGKLYNKAFNKD